MSNLKPSSHGIVVENKESGVRYAVSDANYDPTSERKVRDLKPGESVRSYAPKQGSDPATEGEENSPAGDEGTKTADVAKPTPTK